MTGTPRKRIISTSAKRGSSSAKKRSKRSTTPRKTRTKIAADSEIKTNKLRGTRIKPAPASLTETIDPTGAEKIIRDPLHDLIRVDQFALKVIQTGAFQRLRKIRQLGLAMLVYPGAEHSRFTHSLGAYHLARRVVRALVEIDKDLFSDEEKRAIPLAALCHDIGHGPFSHLFERVSQKFISKDNADHETWTRKIVREDPEVMAALRAAGAEIPGIVFDIICKTYKKKYVSDIVSSQLDVDRFDYLKRDSFMTGVKYGDLDLNWILRTLRIGSVDKDGQQVKTLALDGRRGLSSVESYILGRHYMYIHVYYHKTIQAAECMLLNLLRLAIEQAGGSDLNVTHSVFKSLAQKKVPDLNEYLQINDFDIFYLIQQWADGAKGAIADLSKRLLSRDVFGCIVLPETMNHEERLEKDKQTREILEKNKLPPDQYLIFQQPSDRAFKDLYYHIDAGTQYKHQEIYYIDGLGQTQTLSSAGSFVSKLSFKEERLYVPKEVYPTVREIWS